MAIDDQSSFWPRKLLDILQAAVHIGALAGGIFVLFQWMSAQHANRVERTLSYVNKFEQADTAIGMAQHSIREKLYQQIGNISRLSRLNNDARLEMQTRWIETLMKQGGPNKNPLKKSDIDIVVDFMHGLWICIEQNLCDRDVAVGYFSEYAARFERDFAPFLEKRKLQVIGYGDGLEHLAAMANPKP